MQHCRTHAPRSFGRQNRKSGICGLCGFSGKLSKTHVPPRSAGNADGVGRFGVVNDALVVEDLEEGDVDIRFTDVAIWFAGGDAPWRLEIEGSTVDAE